jgi:uncharacterized protein
MKTHALRLGPGDDLKIRLREFVKSNDIRAGNIITCVGSLKKATLRLADETTKEYNNPFEILSLVGTLSKDGIHLHISVSDEKGLTTGGHVKEGCIIHTTAEIVIGENEDMIFSRDFNKETGFKELTISER